MSYALGMDATFRPAHRLHNGRDYNRVFKRQQKAAGRHVVALVRPHESQPEAHARLGVMIGTKIARSSVRRHQLKRWVREYFRQSLKEKLRGWDLVVLFRSDPPIDGHALLREELDALITKALGTKPNPESRQRRRRS